MLAIPGLHARFLHNHLTDSSSEEATSLGSRPATGQYEERPCRINTHEIAIYFGGVLGRLSGDGGDPRAQWQIPPQPLH